MPGRQRAAIYSRVLVDWQTTEKEIGSLKDVAAQRGWELGEIYVDNALKAGNGQARHQAFLKLLKDAPNGQFAAVMAWSIGQLPRSAQGIIGFVAKMQTLEISQYYHQEAIDTHTSKGKAMLEMCAVLRNLVPGGFRGRMVSGPPRSQGEVHRPGRAKIDPQTEWAICQALASGEKGIVKIAGEFGLSTGTVQRIKAEMNKLS